MNFNEYQKQAKVYAMGHIKDDLSYMILGLCGETGEVAEKFKKIIRDHGGQVDYDHRGTIKEIGDVLWYLSNIARILGYDLEEVAKINLEKLEDRKNRQVLGGSGDNR